MPTSFTASHPWVLCYACCLSTWFNPAFRPHFFVCFTVTLSSMWILRTESDPVPSGEATAFFVTSGSFTIGRQTGKGVDIAIANDPSISRRHAEIAVGPLDVNGPLTVHSSFQLKGTQFQCNPGGASQSSLPL